MMAGDVVSPQMRPSSPHWMPIGAPPINHTGISQGMHQHQQCGHGPGDCNKMQRNATGQAMQRQKLVTSFSNFASLSSSGAGTRVRAFKRD